MILIFDFVCMWILFNAWNSLASWWNRPRPERVNAYRFDSKKCRELAVTMGMDKLTDDELKIIYGKDLYYGKPV